MTNTPSSQPDSASALVRAGLVVLVAFGGAVAANIWSTVVERYTPAYIGDAVVNAGHHVKVAVVYPQAVCATPRYERFQAGFMAELRAHTTADFLDEFVPKEDVDPNGWLKDTADEIKRRGDIDYVFTIGTQATRVFYEHKMPQVLIGGLISSSGAIRGAIDETRVELLRDVADPDASVAAIRVAKALAALVQGSVGASPRVVMFEWQGEESSRQVRLDLLSKLVSHPDDRPHFLSVMDRAQLEYMLDRVDLGKERAVVVLHDRKLLNERECIAAHKSLVFLTSCPDDVQAQDPWSPMAALGYAYEELGRESAQGLLIRMRRDRMLTGPESTTFDFAPRLILRVNLGKLAALCKECGTTAPAIDALQAALAAAAAPAAPDVQIVGGAL